MIKPTNNKNRHRRVARAYYKYAINRGLIFCLLRSNFREQRDNRAIKLRRAHPPFAVVLLNNCRTLVHLTLFAPETGKSLELFNAYQASLRC